MPRRTGRSIRPVAAPAPSWAERDQLGDHPRRRKGGPRDLLARRRARHRPGADDQGGRDHAGGHARQPVLRQALPARHRGDGRERRPRPRGAGAPDRPGRGGRDLRELVPPGGRRDRLVAPGARRAQPHPRGRSASRRVDDHRRRGGRDPAPKGGSTTTRAWRPAKSSRSTATGWWWRRTAARSRSASCGPTANRPPATTRGRPACAPARGSEATPGRPPDAARRRRVSPPAARVIHRR